jgi:uncharacterized protein YbjT (DUF2867 family)
MAAPLLITTPTGKTGRYALLQALSGAAPVRVLVRDPSSLTPEARERCEVIEGDMRDPRTLAAALDGVEAAYFCVPQPSGHEALHLHYDSFAAPFAAAAREAGLRRLVSVSGGAGDGGPEAGMGVFLQGAERLLETSGADIRHLRCGFFMENFFWMAEGLAAAGMFALPVRGDVPVPFVAAEDIGRAGARLLADTSWSGQAGMGAHGPRALSCEEAAAVLQAALDAPVRFQPLPGPDYVAMLTSHGVGEALAEGLVGTFDQVTLGRDMAAPQPLSAPCPTTLEAWARAKLRPVVETACAARASSSATAR